MLVRIAFAWGEVQAIGFVLTGIWALISWIRAEADDPAIEQRALMRSLSWPSRDETHHSTARDGLVTAGSSNHRNLPLEEAESVNFKVHPNSL
jgi:hypothetical protein